MSTKRISRYLLVESPVHGQEVLLAFTPDSTNEKTGPLTQVFILHPDQDPVETSELGLDDRICGTCPLRHSLGGACYVVIFQGPGSTYRGWVNSGRRVDDPMDVLELCAGRPIRFGAYGDIGHIPAWLANELMAASSGWTAYTHEWRRPEIAKTWKGKAMASCDTPTQLRMAEQTGWCGFVATPEKLAGVHVCDNERKGIQCIECMRCDGSHGSVQLKPHGALVKKHPSVKAAAKTKAKTKKK